MSVADPFNVPEGGNATYTVVLDTEPTAAVTVTVARTLASDADLTASPTMLTFSTTDWETTQTVTVAADEDDDGLAGMATFTHTAASADPGYDTELSIDSVTATEVDNDPGAKFTLPTNPLRVPEGGSAEYTVVLNAAPTAAVTVTVAKGANSDADLTASPTTLTFSTTDWDTAQTVTVSATEDDDGRDGVGSLQHTSDSSDTEYASLSLGLVSLLEADDDRGVTVAVADPFNVPEGGSATYTVVLDTEPRVAVAVTVAKVAGGDADLSASPTTLTFDDTDWNTAQTVTISAATDTDGLDGTATFNHTSASASVGYDGLSIDWVAATEADDDRGVTVAVADPFDVPEGGSATYTVVLDTEPTAAVMVAVTKVVGGDADLTASPTMLTFSTTDWETVQTVTISAATDTDGLDGTATFIHRSASSYAGYHGLSIDWVAATEADDDRGVTVAVADPFNVPEGGSATYTVVLDTEPTAAVTVTVAKVAGGDADLTASPTALTFSTANWETVQTVTVSAAEDAGRLDGTATFTHTSASADTGYDTELSIDSVTATEAENDAGAKFTVPTHPLRVAEGGSAEYTVALNTAPTAAVTVTVARTMGSDADLTASPNMLTFSTTDWETAQTVTVSATEDADGVDGAAGLQHTSDSSDTEYAGLSLALVRVYEADDDRGVTVSEMEISVPEGGSATYTVVLDTEPTAAVAVAVAKVAGGDADLTASPTALTFSTANWETVQTVTISAATDTDGLDGTATFNHTSTSSYAGYHRLSIDSVIATEADDDRGVTVAPTEISVPEGGSAEYTVVLDTEPTATVTVTVAKAAGGDADLTASPATLTFSTRDWLAAQTVAITAAADTDGLDGTATFEHTSASSDPGYTGLGIDSVEATEADDDRGVTVSKTKVDVPEGGSATYTVVLDTEPAAAVTVTVSKAADGDADLTASPTKLTFSTTDWDVAQTVTVSAVEDDDGRDGTAIFEHTSASSDPGYTGLIIGEVGAIEADDDRGVTVAVADPFNVPEGGSATYTVVLDTEPGLEVTVTVVKAAGGDADLTASPATLTFSTTDWSTAQTVTISAATDTDGLAGTATFEHTSESSDTEYRGLSINPVTATEVEPGVTVASTEISVPEGGSAEYTVVLNTAPTAAVTVTVAKAAGGDADLTASPTTLTFSTTDWSTAQTVTIAAATDTDGLVGTATFEHTSESSDTGYAGLSIDSVVATEVEPGVTVAPTEISVPEGGSAEYTVVLNAAPTAAVTVTVGKAAGGDADLTASPTTLTFSTTDWSTAQTVTIAAATDTDGLDGTETFRHTEESSDSNYHRLSIDSVIATEADDDRGVTVAPTEISVPEGGSAEYTVVLDTEPTATVTVTVAKAAGGDADLTASPATLTFSTRDWLAAQTVTITAAADTDGLDGTATFTHTAMSDDAGYGGLIIDSVEAAEADDDREVTVSRTSLTVTEGGIYGRYVVVLATAPTAAVTVTVAKVAGGDADLTASPTTLTFSTANWDMPQSVMVTAVEDDDNLDGTATFEHTATSSDAGYAGLSINPVTATEADNDPRVRLSPTTIDVDEGGSDSYYGMGLTAPPMAAVTVTVTKAAGGDADLTASPTTLTFSTTNWGIRQAVRVRAAEDADGLDGTATFTHTAASTDLNYDGLSIASVTATEIDNDPTGVTVMAADPFTVDEGDTATYTVRLATEPAYPVKVTVSKVAGGDGDLTASPATLTFDDTDWNTAQTVTVSAAEDDDGWAGTATFEHAAASTDLNYDITSIASVTATEIDNDPIGVTVLAAGPFTVAESGSATYTVKLDTAPAAAVTVTVTAVGDDDLTASPTTLTFDDTDWNTAQTVTVSAAEDADRLDGTARFLHESASSDPDYHELGIDQVPANENDNDDLVTVTVADPFRVAEDGSATYTMVLATAPTAAVTVRVLRTARSDTDLTRSPAELTFSPTDWETAQTVTVSARRDADGLDGTAVFVHDPLSSDPNYERLSLSIDPVTATEDDDDPIGVTVSRESLTAAEGGSDGRYTVRLATEPTAAVTVTVTKAAGGDADLTASPTTLTFSTRDWLAAQNVFVRAVEDDDGLAGTATFEHTAASSDSTYDTTDTPTLSIASVTATEIENDLIGVTVSEMEISVSEGGSATYTVKLDTAPAAAVTVTVTAGGDADLTASPTTLTFDDTDWNTVQTVTVTAAEDDDGLDGTATFTHTADSSDTTYDTDNTLSIDSVEATEADDDRGVTVSETTIDVDEGGSAEYTVVLDTEPTAAVTVTVSKVAGGDGDLTASPATLTFTVGNSGNWNTAQTVTVSAAEDTEGLEGTATFAHTSASGDAGYAGLGIDSVEATEVENDPGVRVTVADPFLVAEGGSATYTVALMTQPTAAVTVTVSKVAGDDDLTASPATLTFTGGNSGNWDTAQVVTVTAAEDDDGLAGTATFTHTASSSDSNYNNLTANLTATEIDTSIIGVTVSAADPLLVAEGGRAEYTVVLDTQPTAAVTVTVAKAAGGDADLAASPTELVFRPTDWATAQAVTVTAAEDDDGRDGTATFEHSSASADPDYADFGIGSVEASEADDDRGVTVTPTAVMVAEGGSVPYTVVLDTGPTAAVTVTVTVSGDADLTASPTTLTFGPTDWETAQTVTIAAAVDADALAGTATFAHSSASADAGYGTGLSIDSVEASEVEAGVTVSRVRVMVPEGGSAPYTVVLDTPPRAAVTVTVQRAAGGDVDLTPSPTGLVFDGTNWNLPQTVTVSAAEDADRVNGVGNLEHRSASFDPDYHALDIAGVSALEDDNDDLVIVTVPTTPLIVAEGGSAPYTVVLGTAPTAAVTVTVVTFGDGDLAASPAELVFSPTDWETAQTVTVSAAEDDDGLDSTAEFSHYSASSDSNYQDGNLDIDSVEATETDNDRGVTVSREKVAVAEGGSAEYTVVLDTAPAAAVTVTVAKTLGGDADLTASPGELIFDDTNWDVAQNVTVSAAEDDDGLNGTATFTHTAASADPGYDTGLSIDPVVVTETDDDRGVTVAPTTVTVPEGGSAPYTVVLDTPPTAAVTVTVSKVAGGDADLTASPATLTFSPTDWAMAQTVTIAAAVDADGLDGTATFEHTATSDDAGYAGLGIGLVEAVEAEPGVTVTAADPFRVPENSSVPYTVVLDTAPTAAVTVTVTASGDADLTASPTALTFGPADWAVAQTVTISAAVDTDTLAGTATFAHAATSSDSIYNGFAIASVEATETEPGVTVSREKVAVAEGGSVPYTVVLDARPTAAVTVAVQRAAGQDQDADLTASPGELIFDDTDWNVAQTVVVSAAEDADGLDGTATFEHTAASADTGYDGFAIASVIAVEVDDDRGVTVTAADPFLVPEGGSAEYTVVLDTEPTAAVMVTVAKVAGDDASLTASPAVLTFSPANWSDEQTVTISAAADADTLAGTATFTHTSASADPGYRGLRIDAVEASEVEPGVTVSRETVTAPEGGSATYTVVLDVEPTAAVTVTVTASGDADLTASPNALTFGSANWSDEQTVTISAAADADELAGTATFEHTSASADTGYDTTAGPPTLGIAAVVATEAEPGVAVSRERIFATEGIFSSEYELVLDTPPTAAVTVTVSKAAGGDADLTVSPAELTFSAANWNLPQRVTVSALDDDDGLSGTATFEHTPTSSDTTYNNLIIDPVVAAEIDNDSLTVSVAADSASVNEGAAARFTVTVNGGVTSEELTVGFTLSGTATAGDDYTAPGSTVLTFAAGTSSGSLSIATIEDAVLDDGETLIVTLSSLSDTADPVTLGMPDSATATIGDGSLVTLSLSDATVDEGEPAEFTVTMSGRVAREVTVDWTTADDTATAPEDYAAASGRLTFRPDEPLTRTLTVQTSGDARAEGEETFVVRLSNPTDVSGMSLDDDPVGTGTIRDDVEAAARARHDRVNREVLPQLTQAMAASTLSAITGRIDAAISDTPAAATNLLDLSDLDRLLRSSGQALGDDAMSLERFLDGSSFVLPLGGAGGGAPGLTVWGSGDYRELSDGEDSGVDWSGDVRSFHLGADTRLRPDLLAGFAVSRSLGSFDYTDRTDPLTISGDYESRMTSVHPYVNWSVREGLEVWTTVGYGRGEVEIEEAGLATRVSDTEMKTAAAGLNRALWSQDDLMEGGPTTLRFKGEGLFARVKLEGSDRMNPLTSEVQRVRMLLEASHDRRLASGSSVVPSLEVGLRYDGGDGVTGAGAELGGTLRYHDPAFGLTVEGRARVLVTHRDDYEEWGVGGRVQIDPGGDGRGLSLNVAPTWGELESGHSRLYDEGTADLAIRDDEPAVSLDAEIGYGWGTSGGRGLLTPYGGLTLSGADEQRYRLGGRFELGRSFDLSLEGERRETGATADHSLMLRAQMRF